MLPVPELSKYTEEQLRQYASLKPHPDYPFENGDKVRYRTFDHADDSERYQYCILIYSPDSAAFILANYQDETFNSMAPSEQEFLGFELLSEIGIEALEKI